MRVKIKVPLINGYNLQSCENQKVLNICASLPNAFFNWMDKVVDDVIDKLMALVDSTVVMTRVRLRVVESSFASGDYNRTNINQLSVGRDSCQ